MSETKKAKTLLVGEMSPDEAIRRVERWLDYFASNMGENPADYQAFDFVKYCFTLLEALPEKEEKK